MGLASYVPPQGNSVQDAAEECSLRPEKFLDERLAVWQKRLRLDGWKISIVLSQPSALRPSSLGNIRWDAAKKQAVIRVLHPAEYKKPCREVLADMEFTVVHELIHLELSSLPRSHASRTDEERAVNNLAEALLQLDRAQP